MIGCRNCGANLSGEPTCQVCGYRNARPARWPDGRDPVTEQYLDHREQNEARRRAEPRRGRCSR